MGLMDEVNEKRKKNIQSSTGNSNKTGSLMEELRYRTFNTDSVNEDYIKSFVSDAESFFNEFGTGNTQFSYNTLNNTIKNLDTRYSTIRGWLYKNKENIDSEVYNNYSTSFANFENYLDGVKTTFSQWETEEDYNKAMAEAAEYENKKNLDLVEYQNDINEWKAKLNDDEYKDYRKDIKSNIKRMEAYLEQAKRIQEGIKLSGVIDPNSQYYDSNFKNYTGYKSTKSDSTWDKLNSQYGMGYDDLVYEYINGDDGMRSEIYRSTVTWRGDTDKWDIIDHMTKDEITIYNYYYSKNGKEKAEEYLDSIQESLNAREAARMFGNLEGNTGFEMLFGVVAGLDQFKSGIQGLFADGYTPTSTTQMVGGMVREDLGDSDFKIFGNTLGQIGYDVLNTGANMLPSILVSYVPVVGQVAGVGLLGASAAGNGKVEMLNLGYSKAQANAYGLLVGASEGLLQYALGGVTKLGGKAPQGITNLILSKVDNAFARTAIKIGGNMLAEGFEEGLQTVLESWFKSIVTGVDFEAPNVDEVLYSSLLGALSAGMLEGAGTIAGEVGTYKQGKQALAQGIDVSKLSEFGTDTKFFSADSVAYRLAGKVNENTGAYTVGRLLNEMNAQLTAQNQADIIRSLERKNFSSKDAKTIATALADVVAGVEMTEKQAKALESNPLISQTIQDVIINKNSTVNQRLMGYNEALKPKSSTATQETTEQAETTIPTENSTIVESAENKAENVSDRGKTVNKTTGEEVNIQKVTETKGGLKVELDNGMVVSASDLSYSTKEEALMYEMAARMEASPTSTNAMLNMLKPSSYKEASMYYMGVPLAYQYGKIGYEAGLKSIKLSQKAKQLAYKLGREDAQANATSKDNARAVASQTKTETKTEEKGIIYENGFTYDESKANKIQKVSMAYIDVISKMTSVEVHVFESKIVDGKRMAVVNGKLVPAPNGYFKNGNQIYIDINAGNNGEGAMLLTMGHEITHYIRRWNEQGFKELGDFLLEQYGKAGVSVERRLGKQRDKIKNRYESEGKALPTEAKLNDMAYEELVADAMSDMLADPKAYEKLAQLKQQNLTLWQKVGEAIKSILKKFKKALGIYKDAPVAREAYYVRDFAPEVYEKLQDLYIKAFVEADANYEAFIGSRNLNDFADAVNENGEALFQYKAMEADEEQYRHMLHKWGKMSAVQIDNLFDTIDNAMELIKANLEALDYAWDVDIDDRSFSPIKKNTDKLYKVSVDFSTLCRKRLLQQTIQGKLQEALDRSLTKEEGIAIRDALMTIQEEGRQIEIACALCYVGSARMKSHNQIKRFLNNRENVLKDFFASKSGGDIKSRIKQAEAEARERLGVGNTPLTRLPANEAKEIRDAKKEAKASYVPSSEEAELIKVAKGMTVNDFATPAGLENLAKNYPELFDAYASFIVNATHAKGIENDTWWRAGDSYARNKSGDINISDTLIDNMNRENGLRSQSWSDFQVIHLLDYIAATIELSTRNSKEQIYTKVPDFVDLMGLTNAMLNMSLIPTREFKGSLEYDAVEGMPYDMAVKLREAYPNTAGTICIGIDNEQIKMLLADIIIDYVIPYHKSGMSAHTRKAMHLPTWSEYEDYQSEKNLSRADAEKQAKKYGVKLLDASDPNYQKGTSFSEWFDLREAQQITKMENAHPTDKAKQKKYGVMYGGYMAMQNAANNYLKLCAERGLSPKFSHENANFTAEENYWKLLIDRKMVNNATGEIIEQQSLKPIFSEEKILRILNDELERYPKVKADQEYAIRRVTEKMLSGEIKGGMSAKAIADVMKKPVDNVAKVNILASAEDMKLSDRDSLGNELSAEQQEFFKDSKVRDEEGRLLVLHRGSPENFGTVFRFLKENLNSKDKPNTFGFFFTDNLDTAEYYSKARGNEGDIKTVYLDIKNPLDLTSLGISSSEKEFYRLLEENGIITGRSRYKQDYKPVWTRFDKDGESMRRSMESAGFDGVIYHDWGENKSTYVAFYSEQIKDVTNKKPTSDPDIRYSDRDSEQNSFNPEGKTLREQLEDAYSSSESFDQRYVYVGRFSNEFRELLKDNDIILHDYPIAMNYRDAYLSMHSKETGKYHGDNINYHNLGVTGLEAALESFKSPLNVMKSKKEGKIELVLQGVDKKGNSLLSIVVINTVTQNGRKFLDAHIVTSVYGRRSIDSYIAKAEQEGRLIKPKKEETPQGIPQVQYEGNINEISSGNMISQNPNSVNSEFSDNDYLNAVNSGDMKTAQKMVDEAAKKAGYTIKAHHGTNADFTVFDKSRVGKGIDQYGAGFYFASNKDVSQGYGQKVYDTYLSIKKPINLIDKANGGKTLYDVRVTQAQAYQILKRHPLMYDSENSPLGDFYDAYWEVGAKEWMVKDLAKKYDSIGQLDGDVILYRDYPNELHEAIRDVMGYDGVVVYFETDKMVDERNDYFYVAWFDNQMKSSDPVTYDADGKVIPLSERFNTENNDIRYSDRDTETVSNRSLLVNALEGVAQNDIEKNRLKQYKDKIALIESEQAKLTEIRAKANELRFTKGRTPGETKTMRDLDAEATQIANRISTYDKQLLNLEATTALKNVLQREKDMLRKRERQKGYEALRAYKESALKAQSQIISHYQESRKKTIENRHKTEMRHKIKSVVSDLNKLLLHGTKERNIKLGLQEAVALALEAVNMDTVSADARIANLKEDLLKAKTPEKIEEIQHKIDYIKNMGDNMSDKLEALRKAYREIRNSTGKDVSSQFKEEASLIENKIESVISKVGSTPLRDMSMYQLEQVYELYKMVLTTVRNANSIWREGKLEDLQQNASAVMEEIDKHPKMKSEGSKLRQIIRQFKWNEMTPYYAFDNIGSATLKKLFYDFVEAQNVYGRDVKETKLFAQSVRSKYGYGKWDLDKMYEFQLKDGRVFSTTLKHLMSIYAYSKREQALDHMSRGGFFHNDKQTFRKKGGIIEMVRTDDVGYKIDSDVLYEIKKALTKEQLAYVDEMQEYLTKMGEKGNEVTRVMWGIDIFKEKVYFPLKSKNDFIKSSTETAQAVSLKNDGMTKETVPGASNPIVLEAFDDVWAAHTERMSQYHAFVIPIDNMNKVHQYGTWAGTESTSVSTMLAGRFGNAVNEYITQFIKDMNGSVVTQGVTNPFIGFFSKFKKTAVGMSLSTVVQQPTAIIRAMSVVDGKYFVGKPNLSRLSTRWEELQTYAPIAIIKEIGGFDAGSGMQVTKWINSDTARGIDKVMNVIDDVSMKGAELADQIGWVTIWEAVKREVKATTNLEVGSEAFLKKAGERFTEVIVKTQVYDSTLSRSAFMRSKNDGVKMLTSFMGEPTLSINMMYNAMVNAIRGGKTEKLQAAKTIGFVYASAIMASVFASAIYALNDDDEDESYLEKYMQALGGETVSDIVLLPVTSLPVFRDIVSIFQGWDVERADMSIFKDIYDSFTTLDSENKSTYRKIEDFAGSIGAAFGLPVKNLLRTGRQLYNAVENIIDGIEGGDLSGAFVEGVTGEEKSKSQKLYEAILNGDTARLETLKKGYKSEEAYEQAVRKALKENDPRIQEAAQARYDGDISEYTRIAKEIIAEGNFTQDTVVSAINSAITDIKNGQPSEETEEEQGEDEVTSIYSTSDINSAFENGDNAMALEIIQDLIDTKVANGKEEKEAKSSLRSSMTSYWKPLYKQAYQQGNTSEMYRIRKILLASGLYGSGDDVVNTVKNWLK